MGWIKKTALAMVFIAGVITLTCEFQAFGLQVGLVLTAAWFLSTTFLWHWASGYLPQMGRSMATLIMMIFTFVLMGTVEYAMADFRLADLPGVVGTTLKHSTWFYLVMFIGAGLKVFFWNWLFAGVREEQAAQAAQA